MWGSDSVDSVDGTLPRGQLDSNIQTMSVIKPLSLDRKLEVVVVVVVCQALCHNYER